MNTNVDVCYNRIMQRNRTEESLIPRIYLEKLEHYHNEWLHNCENSDVLFLNINEDFEHNDEIFENMVETIDNFIEKNEVNNILNDL